ncbi:UPF0235 protein C15orf40 homolog [Paramacrobiotus metropolitanus]|uniref:UPF0235 protein C15orf40 homolog n=1 Tax=Paramacrobiotus metropolitanus TaxID=2943436 RepID=UPI002445F39A|nr:UPF0235 protein C15orf40 homolog [Paramacrobiotus metropolitanus]
MSGIVRCVVMAPKTTASSAKQARAAPVNASQSVKDLPGGTVAIAVHAKPNAKQSAVVSISKECVEVQIGAAARDGEANSELLEFLADVLHVKKTLVSLDRGSKSREKVVLVTASTSAREVLERLTMACQSQ